MVSSSATSSRPNTADGYSYDCDENDTYNSSPTAPSPTSRNAGVGVGHDGVITEQYTPDYEEEEYNNLSPQDRLNDYEDMNDKPLRKSCCSYPLACCALLLFIAGIACIWTFVPFGEIVGSVIPDFDPPPDYEEGDDSVTDRPTRPPVNAPSAPTVDNDVFHRCAADTPDKECCNGSELVCDLRFNDVLFPMPHNSMSTRDNGHVVAANHLKSLEKALKAGFRGLNLDVCKCGVGDGAEEELRLCHGFCGVGARDFGEVLGNVVSFLKDNLGDVVMIVFEMSVGDPTMEELYEELEKVNGLVELLYVHSGRNAEWPLMKDLIADGKRLIAFHHSGPRCECWKDDKTCSTSTTVCPNDGLHYLYDYAIETPFQFDTISSVRDTSTSCQFDRGASSTRSFYVVNHFTTFAIVSNANVLNQAGEVERRVDECRRETGLLPNVFVVDFWSVGDVLKVAQDINVQRAGS